MDTPAPLTLPTITPRNKWQYAVRKGLHFELSGRMDEPEVIFNSSDSCSGCGIGLSELYQLAAICGQPVPVQNLRAWPYPRKLTGYKWSFVGGNKLKDRHQYGAADEAKYYEYTDHPGYGKFEVVSNREVWCKVKWGSNKSDIVDLFIEDILAVIEFLTPMELDKYQNWELPEPTEQAA